jgi:hypothetical protein
MAREIVYENDEGAGFYGMAEETPEARWFRMREWVRANLKVPA